MSRDSFDETNCCEETTFASFCVCICFVECVPCNAIKIPIDIVLSIFYLVACQPKNVFPLVQDEVAAGKRYFLNNDYSVRKAFNVLDTNCEDTALRPTAAFVYATCSMFGCSKCIAEKIRSPKSVPNYLPIN